METCFRAGRGLPRPGVDGASQGLCSPKHPASRVTRRLGLPELVLAYTCCPSVLGDSTPFSLKSGPIWVTNNRAIVPKSPHPCDEGDGEGSRKWKTRANLLCQVMAECSV